MSSAVAASSAGHLFTSSDDGEHWQDITPATAGRVIGFYFLTDASAVLATATGSTTRDLAMWATSNAGTSWSQAANVAADSTLLAPRAVHFATRPSGGLAASIALESGGAFSDGATMVSPDGGLSWGAPRRAPIGAAAVTVGADDSIWLAGGADGMQLYSSSDLGRDWTAVTAPLKANWIDALGMDAQNLIVVLNDTQGEDRHVHIAQLPLTGRSWTTQDVGSLDTARMEGPAPASLVGADFVISSGGDPAEVLERHRGVTHRHPAKGLPGGLTNLALGPNGTVWASATGGKCVGQKESQSCSESPLLLHSSDRGQSWVTANSPLTTP